MGTAEPNLSVEDLALRLTAALGANGAQIAGDRSQPAGTVGIVCGSGGDMLSDLITAGCTTLVTGEVRLHTAAEAAAAGLAVIAVGHHASERFSMDRLADLLTARLPGVTAWASRLETDPLTWVATKH
jgi:putative NIF3 family GTP cyclohydrolase 1 type 2